METYATDPSVQSIVDAIMASPTGEIDDNLQPMKSYEAIGTKAIQGYNYGNSTTATRSTTKT